MTKEEKTKQAFEMIEQGVKDVYSSDNFRKYLSCCSKFHSYSLNNTLLILAQKPDATLVAGYNAWQHNFNRHVDKGEKQTFEDSYDCQLPKDYVHILNVVCEFKDNNPIGNCKNKCKFIK